jgi:hypothetical protein
VRSSTIALGQNHIAKQLATALAKVGHSVFASPKADSLTLPTPATEAWGQCAKLTQRLKEVEERHRILAEQQRDNGEVLKREGVILGGTRRLGEIKQAIDSLQRDEDTLAATLGRTYADRLFDEEGRGGKDVKKAVEKSVAGEAGQKETLLSALTDEANLRRHIGVCKLDLRVIDLSGQIIALAEKIRRGTERIDHNKGAIEKLLEENTELETMISTSNDLCQKLISDRTALEERRSKLSSLVQPGDA